MARKIKLKSGSFAHATINPKMVLTSVTVSAPFDQIVAAALGVKESVYDENGHCRVGLRTWGLDTLLYGAAVTISVKQGDLFSGNGNGSLKLTSVQTGHFNLRKAKADEGLNLRFQVVTAGIPRELFDYIEVVKSETIDIEIEIPNKQKQDAAMEDARQYGLLARQADGDEEGDEDEGEKSGDVE